MKAKNKFFNESEKSSTGGKSGCGCSSKSCAGSSEYEEEIEISDTKVKE